MKVLLSIVVFSALWLLSSQAMAQAPVITCPSDITISCSQPADPAVTGSATAVDDDDPNPIISYTDVLSGECPLIITRTWVAQDHSGNTSEPCTQIITVVDDQPPVISCQDQSIDVGDPLPSPPSITDCDPEPSVVGSDSMIAPNVVLRRWLVTDKCGNVSECSQTVTILYYATVMVESRNVDFAPITVSPPDYYGVSNGITSFFPFFDGGVVNLTAPVEWNGQIFQYWIVMADSIRCLLVSEPSVSITINAYNLPTHTNYGILQSFIRAVAVYEDSCKVGVQIDPGMLRTFDAIKGGNCGGGTVEHIVQLVDCAPGFDDPYFFGAYCGLEMWWQWVSINFVLPQKCKCPGSDVDSVKMVMLNELGEIARLGPRLLSGPVLWEIDNHITWGEWDLAAFCSDGSHSILQANIVLVGDVPYYPDGIVTNKLTGHSVPGIMVSLYRWIRPGVYQWYAETTTLMDGTYDFGDVVFSGTYKLRVINPDRILFPQEVWSDAFTVASPIPYMEFSLVPANNDVTAPTIDLDTIYIGGVREIHGTFTDNETGIYARTITPGSDQNIELSFDPYTIGSATVSFVAIQIDPALPATTILRCVDMVGNFIEFPIEFPAGVPPIEPTGVIAGNAKESGVGLVGLSVDLFDNDGNLVASTNTDQLGHYAFSNLERSQYSVSITPPLGYSCNEPIKTVALVTGTATVNFDLSKLNITPQQRSRDYWAGQLTKILQNKPASFTKAQFSRFAGLISQHFNDNLLNQVETYEVPQPANQNDSLNLLKKLLTFGCTEVNEPFLKKVARGELVALMLNVASGKVSQAQVITQDGATLSQAITYCDMLINEADCPIGNVPSWFMPGYPNRLEIMRYLKASFVAGLINIGVKLPSGQIPLDIMNIAYKTGLENNSIPSGYSLDQNQPNPFNPITLIRFAIPQASSVRLEVLNVLGQVVRTLVNEFQTAGTHSVEWNSADDSGNRVASGIYLYRITAGDFTETKKMVLMK